jgi:hypothetical protein
MTKSRTILLIFIVIFCNSLYSQSLTNRLVFDYSSGDVFITKLDYSGVPNPPQYAKDSILSKYYSNSLDTLFYRISRTNYTPPNGPNSSATYSSDTIIEHYIHLDSIATHLDKGSYCNILPTDSFYLDNCYNKEAWNYSPRPPLGTTCFEPTYFTSTLVKGNGGPYYSYFSGQDPNNGTYSYELIYSKKGNVICGNYYDFPVSLKELIKNKIAIFPNPTPDMLNISFGEIHKNVSIVINDINGKMIISKTFKNKKIINLNLKNLISGVYFIHFKTEKISSTKKIIKQ